MNRFKYAIITIIAAAIFWFEMFYLKSFNFWIEMSIAAALLSLASIIINNKADRNINKRLYDFEAKHILIGLISAAVLYGVFYLGDVISKLIIDFADRQVTNIYDNKELLSPAVIAFLLFFLIGPAEEIFWRGFIQDTFQNKFGENAGWLIASFVYAGVHIFALNFMLFMAALICGLFWGWIYKKYKKLWPGIISHAVWDVVIFVLFPVR
jgi:membrane protease YdiL (CAAX protease family)